MTMTDLDECASKIAELWQDLMAKKASLSPEQVETYSKKLTTADNFVQSLRNSMLDDISSDEEFQSVIEQLGEVSDFLSSFVSHTPPIAQQEEPVATKRRRTLVGIPYEVSRGQGGWEMCEQSFSVRGQNYLNDNVKHNSDSPLFHMCGMQIVRVPQLKRHVAQEQWCALPKSRSPDEEWLVMNYMVPGASQVQVICLYSAGKDALAALGKGPSTTSGPLPGWGKSLQRFWQANEDYCNSRFKLIPNVVRFAGYIVCIDNCAQAEGPWAVKMAVGNKPALTGKKLQQYYHRGDGYLEIDLDIGSSSVASRILSLVREACSRLTVDIAITIEGNEADELPERVLCATRWQGLSFSAAQPLSA